MCVGTTVVPLMTFVVGNVFFVVLDLTGKPACMLKYKIQEEKGVPVSNIRRIGVVCVVSSACVSMYMLCLCVCLCIHTSVCLCVCR